MTTGYEDEYHYGAAIGSATTNFYTLHLKNGVTSASARLGQNALSIVKHLIEPTAAQTEIFTQFGGAYI